jgi:hypothetical protein
VSALAMRGKQLPCFWSQARRRQAQDLVRLGAVAVNRDALEALAAAGDREG